MPTIVGTGGNDTLNGSQDKDTIEGREGDDLIDGGAGADRQLGGAGNDRFIGIDDGDFLDGGPGWDSFEMSSPVAADTSPVVTIDMASGVVSWDGKKATVVGVEELYSSKFWTLDVYGDDGDNLLSGRYLVGRGGNDVLLGDEVDYRATSAALTLIEQPFSVTFPGRPGAVTGPWRVAVGTSGEQDYVNARIVRLGSGNDVAELSSTAPIISFGNSPYPQIYGGPGNDRLRAYAVFGGPGNDTLEGVSTSYADSPGPLTLQLELGVATTPDGVDQIRVRHVRGTPFDDLMAGDAQGNGLVGAAGNDVLYGEGGADTLEGSEGNDRLEGGPGDDVLRGNIGRDTMSGDAGNDVIYVGVAAGQPGTEVLDGGAGVDVLNLLRSEPAPSLNGGGPYDGGFDNGFSTLRNVVIDMRQGTLRLDGEAAPMANVLDIEAFVLTPGNDRVVGHDGVANRVDEWFMPSYGNDTVDGGAGIDCGLFNGLLSEHRVTLVDAATLSMRVTFTAVAGSGGSDSDELTRVERLRFTDGALAFGDRAIEAAKVAFALWTPAIASSRNLFGYGIDWYDQGHSYDELIGFALGWWKADSDAQLAARLAQNTGLPANVALSLMAAAGGGDAGRLAATKAAADSAGTLASVGAAGFLEHGITCAIDIEGWQMFVAGLPSIAALTWSA